MVMIFQNEKARRQLLEKGVVYTFRKKPHKYGRDWATDRRGGKKICDIEVVWRTEASPSMLHLFVKDSGFKSLREWKEAIRELGMRESDWGYIHEVKRTERKERKGRYSTSYVRQLEIEARQFTDKFLRSDEEKFRIFMSFVAPATIQKILEEAFKMGMCLDWADKVKVVEVEK